jgi:hypothetical protein
MPLVEIGARLRAICLALPEAYEEALRRGPSYRVQDKIFALERPWNNRIALWCKARVSRWVLREAGGATPPAYSPEPGAIARVRPEHCRRGLVPIQSP